MWIEERESRQLPLPFGTTARAGLPPFLPSPTNEEARRMVQAWQAEVLGEGGMAGSHGLLVCGAEGTGKTLLMSHVGEQSGSKVYRGPQLCDPSQTLPDDPILLLDDVHQCDASGLMRVINACLERGRPYLMAGRGKPQDWAGAGESRLVDLASRLSASPDASLHKPDEELLAAVIRQRLAARQVRIDLEVAAFAAAKLRRSLHSAARFAEAVDSEALARQKSIDKTLAQHVLSLIPDAVL